MTNASEQPRVFYQLVREPVDDGRGHVYYGVDRDFAPGLDWENSPAKSVWMDYVSAPWGDDGWDAFFPSLELAREFQSRFRGHDLEFAIIGAHLCESAADAAAVERLPGYLGLDVADTEPQSVVRPEWLWDELDYQSDSNPLFALWALPPKYFRERVNRWGLLYRYDDAAFYRDVIRALARIDESHQTPTDVLVLGVQEISS